MKAPRWLGPLNAFILQWFFVRLALTMTFGEAKKPYYSLHRWVWPLTGWGNTRMGYLTKQSIRHAWRFAPSACLLGVTVEKFVSQKTGKVVELDLWFYLPYIEIKFNVFRRLS